MSTFLQPFSTACLVRRTESVSAQQPVPTMSRSGSMPASSAASRSAMRSSTEKEFASLVVPNSARPWQPLSSSQRAWSRNRSLSTPKSSRTGISTGDQTPWMGRVTALRLVDA